MELKFMYGAATKFEFFDEKSNLIVSGYLSILNG